MSIQLGLTRRKISKLQLQDKCPARTHTWKAGIGSVPPFNCEQSRAIRCYGVVWSSEQDGGTVRRTRHERFSFHFYYILAQGLTHILSFGDFSRSSLPGSRESEPPWWVIRAGLLGVEALIQDRV